jgi:hypothetical protein
MKLWLKSTNLQLQNCGDANLEISKQALGYFSVKLHLASYQ